MKRAFVFDMDGVLLDSARLLMDCVLAAAPAGYDRETLRRAMLETLGVAEREVRRIIFRHMGEDFPFADCVAAAEERYFAHVAARGVPLKPGARELLGHLKAGGYTIGLASSSTMRLVERQLAMANLINYFEALTTGDMVQNSKPAPDIYRLACHKLAIPPERAYAIEDAPKGVQAAAAAGLSVLMVPDLEPATAALATLCERVFPSLLDVLDWVKACESNESE